jgi:hypothetical protein
MRKLEECRAVFTCSLLALAWVPELGSRTVAKANKRRLRQLEEWKRKELQRTPFAILDEPPEELRPKNGRK